MVLLFWLGCAPPPWTPQDTAGPEADVRFLFPVTADDVSYCPEFTAIIDVDAFLITAEGLDGPPVAGVGHWHLRDGDTLLVDATDQTAPLITPLNTGGHALYAELVGHDHQPLVPETWHRAAIQVSDDEGCVGGDSGWGE